MKKHVFWCRVHAVTVVLIVGAGIGAVAWPPFLMVAVPVGLLTAFLNMGKECPFTVYEKQDLGEDAYEGPFISHYAKEWFGVTIHPLLFPGFFTGCLAVSFLRLLTGH